MRVTTLISCIIAASIQATLVSAVIGRGPPRCECFDIPACPANQLAGRSLCSCQNQAELFCWKRTGTNICPSPLPYDCDRLGQDGRATVRITPEATVDSRATSSFTAKYTAPSGLHCVDLGYCFRPAKSMTKMTVTLANGSTQIISVPVGLPTQTLVPQARTSEPVIVFTPERLGIDEVVGGEEVAGQDPVAEVKTVEEQEARLGEVRRRAAKNGGSGSGKVEARIIV